MTDKEQIIINGVDVNECAYFDYENEGTRECDAYGNECEANNCYFKQLARKTQECEELKKQLNFVRTHRTVIEAECKRYRKALEEIEKVLSHCIMTGAIVKILTIINKAKGEE